MYKCFSCGAAGNVFTFVQNYENVSFGEAINIIASKVGYNLNIAIPKKVDDKYKKEYEMMDIALKYYENNLNTPKGEEAKKYLNERGLSEDDIKTFDIGLALNTNSLNKLLEKKGYTFKEMRDLGLISDKDTIYDIFFNRILFPIHNLEGKVVGFTGRIFNGDGTPKYLGSKETNIYKKSNILFNYHRAKEHIKLKKELIIVEGNMDAIRLYINGIKNVVALMGTALTKEQIDIIKKLRCKVILMLDNDNAGEKDPDDYIINNGVEAILKNINNAIPINEFKLNYLKKDKNLTNTDDLVKYIKVVIEDLKKSNDDLLKEVTLKKLSVEYNLSYDILKSSLKKQK